MVKLLMEWMGMKKLIIALIIFSAFLFGAYAVVAASLSAPSYVNAFIYKSGNIQVNWDENVPDAAGFAIQRKTDLGNFITIANVSKVTSKYNDLNITNGHYYTYMVYATSGSTLGESTESFAVEYLFPTELMVKPVSDSEIILSWKYPYSNNIPETNYQTIIERREDGSSTWQTISSVLGGQNSFVDTGLLEASRYFYRIRTITATSAPYLYFPDNSTGYYTTTLLKAPTNIKAEITSASNVRIAWKDNSDKESGYRIERRTGNGNFISLISVASGTTSYEDKSAVNGELYTYRVTAFGPFRIGTPSEEITVPFLFPVSFELKETYNTQITLSWSYPGSGYIKPDNNVVIIERKESDNDLWEFIHTTKSGETEYTDCGLKPGTKYYYRIRSRYNDGFITDYFPTATGISKYTKLKLNSHFYGYAISDSEIRLEWDKDAIGDQLVIIEKLSGSGVYERLTSLTRSGSFIDNVEPGSINTYRMKISAGVIDSDFTEVVDIAAERLNPVKNLNIKSITPERIFITWEFGDATETGFEIWRLSNSEGVWSHIATTDQGHYMYSDTNIHNGETYTYRVRALKSITTFSRFLTTAPVTITFPEPDGLLVVSKSDNVLYLGWNDFSDMERYYIVEYKTNVNDLWHILDKIPANATMYHFVPEANLDYTIRVRAYNDYPIFESCSNEVFYSTKLPDIPSLFAPTVVGSNRVVLKWADMSSNEDEFIICRRDHDLEEDYAIIGSVSKNTVVYSDKTVLPQTSYEYVVRAKNAAGLSFESNEVIVKTPGKTFFSDISTYKWALDAINSLTAMGIVEGDGKGNYNPAGNVTRAEFTKLLVATFSFPETPIGSFKDVSTNDWYHRWVMTAYRKGIVEPDANDMFHPNKPITRQDIVYFSIKAIEAAGYKLEQAPLYIIYWFDDYDEISPYAQSAFAALNYAGIINGVGSNKLGPQYPATRAEAATIIYRMIQALESAKNR